MINLTDKIAMVLGGVGCLGLPICKKLAQQRASVIVADKYITGQAIFVDGGFAA